MELLEYYHSVSEVLRSVDFEQLFPGFRPYRWAIYNSKTICLDGNLIPYDQQFFGNTALLYEGEYIAIWNMEADPVEDPELLAHSMVHEMFHCHQFTMHEGRFPSDLTLLNYPADLDHYIRKYNENCFLADAFEQTDAKALKKFAAIRNRRHAQYPNMVREEWKVETCEGMAEYIGLKALEQINAEKFRTKLDDYLSLLREANALQLDIRRISYYTGTLLLLCMDRFGFELRNDFGSSLTVYEQNPLPADDAPGILPCPSLESAYEQMMTERTQAIREHIAASAFTECEGEICGYDPMNMFRVDQLILFRQLLFLKTRGEVQSFFRKIVVVLQDGSDTAIKGYY